MTTPPVHPLVEYQKAFMLFADCPPDAFKIIKADGALVKYEQQTYRVCHYDDLLNELRSLFDLDLSLVYSELPFELWESIAALHDEISEEDLIIDIYNSWKLYWENQDDDFEEEHLYNRAKERSWKEFEQLVKKVQQQPGSFVTNAVAISDVTLIPVVALALRSRFNNPEDFYRECTDVMIKDYPANFGSDGNFDAVEIDGATTPKQTYYIFQPDYNYDDVVEIYKDEG